MDRALQHISVFSRIDMTCTTMRLFGYNVSPSLPYFEALNQIIGYLYHHSHVPTMYPRKQVITLSINVHYAKGERKIVNIKKISDYPGMK